jgi:glycine oxidase
VVAAGSWSALVRGAAIAEGAVRPVRGQMIAFPAAPGLGARVLSCASGYAVPRQDRVLVGATVEEVGFEKANTREGLEGLLATAERLMPGSSAQKILEQWSGLRPGSRDGLPLLGAPVDGPRGLFVCTGHHRNGILLTPISAELIRDAVLGRTPSRDLAPFRPERF